MQASPHPTPLLLLMLIFTFNFCVIQAQLRLEKNFSLPVVLWTQRSDNWWNLRGIAGNVSAWVPRSAADLSYVEAAPSAISRGAVDYDRVSGVVYWSQSPADTSSSWSIGAQPVVDALSRKSTSVMQFLSSWHVGGLAVDWFTGNVYVTETEQQLIAVARYDIHDTDMYRIIISSGLEKPSAIAIDPYLGRIFWISSQSSIWSSTTAGKNVTVVVDRRPKVIYPVGLCVDTYRQRLYWYDIEYRSISTSMYNGLDFVLYRRAHSFRFSVENLAVHKDHLFATTGKHKHLVVYDQLNASRLLAHIDVGASLYDVTIVNDVTEKPPPHECDTLRCDHLCINDGHQRGHCECKQGQSLQQDGRRCEASHTTYVYSVGPSLVLVDVDIDDRHPDDIRASPRVVLSDRGRVQALATHVDQALVYFSDTDTGAIYRTTRNEWDAAELTVQQPHVEGLAIHWEDKILFWSDMNLGHIMYSQLDGRYHAFLLTGLVKPKALAVDPVDGMLYWSVGGAAARYIHRTTLDGAAADNVQRFIDVTDSSVSTAAEAAVQDIVVDVRTRSLYWSDPGSGKISSCNLDTRQKRLFVSFEYSAHLYGIAVFQNYVTWTNRSSQLQFVVDAVGGVRRLDVKSSNAVSPLPAYNASYGVVLLDKYIQPNVSSGCKSAHGPQCQHHCISGQRTSRCSCAIGFTLSDDQRTCDTNLVTDSFLLFTDPYHKQVYQLPTSDDLPVVRGVAMPTDAQFPISVDFSVDEDLVYWIDSSARHIISTKLTAAEHSIIAKLPQGSRAVRLAFSEVSRRLYFTDWERGSINVIDVQQSDTTPQPLITGLNNPLPITTRPQHRTIYWAEAGVIKSSTDDGTDIRILADDLGNITAIDISQDGIMYAVDILDRRILAINLTTLSVTNIYHTRDDRRPYTLAVGQQYIYFSAWNRKGIYRLSRHNSTEAEMIGEAVFARITDLKYIEKIALPPPPGYSPNLALIIGLAALGLLLLLLLLILIPLIVVARRRRRRLKAVNDVSPESSVTTATTMDSGGSSWSDYVTAPEMGSPRVPTSRATDDIINYAMSPVIGAALSNGSSSLPQTSAVARNAQGSQLTPRSYGMVHRSTVNEAIPTPPAAGGNGQVPQLPPRSYSMVPMSTGSRPLPKPPAPAPGSDSTVHCSQADPLRGLGPEQPKRWGPTGSYVFIPPKLHREPRGWAPASHNVPLQVKRTWGRAGAKQVVQQ